MLKTLLGYLISFAILVITLLIGNAVQQGLALTIPGSIIGMLLLLAAMTSGVIKPHWVQPSSQLIIRHMVLLFIPISVGLIEHTAVLSEYALQILLSTAGGTLLMMIALALTLEKLLVKQK